VLGEDELHDDDEASQLKILSSTEFESWSSMGKLFRYAISSFTLRGDEVTLLPGFVDNAFSSETIALFEGVEGDKDTLFVFAASGSLDMFGWFLFVPVLKAFSLARNSPTL